MRRMNGRRLAAILLALLMLLTETGTAAMAENRSAGERSSLSETLFSLPESLSGTDAAAASGKVILGRSKKKKTTAAPDTATPVPASQETSADPEGSDAVTPTPVPDGPVTDPQSIADYLFAHGKLPENFITKKEAQRLGWDSSRNYVGDVAPGKSIGGDRFGNYEGRLPQVDGRQYFEADCYYTGRKRNAYRIIYSNDGHVWFTADHYNTFTELFPTGTEGYVSPVSSFVP